MEYFAHSRPDAEKARWESLRDHLLNVARSAESFGRPLGIGRAAALAGLLHDLGKYTAAFQARLHGSTEQVDHSTAGAAMVREITTGRDRQMAELIAFAIAGHHAGLPDWIGEDHSNLRDRLESHGSPPDPVWRSEVPPEAHTSNLVPTFPFVKNDQFFDFQVALLGRMIFSCLVDADYKETERFYGRTADRDWPDLRASLPDLLLRFRTHVAGKPSHGDVNALRREVLDHVLAQAGREPGLFTLTVPTGGGKTLASLGFTLEHARQHRHTRVIFGIPFTAIIDQTAETLRRVLGDGMVLEHHSALDDERRAGSTRSADSAWSDRTKLELAMEDWAAPVIATTTVQLFESLFAARTSRARKLHNIANSVIVLDEAQVLPRPLLMPIVRTIEALARDYGCTIVLCTATQPALDARHLAHGLDLAGRELAPDPPRLAAALTRTRLRDGGDMTDADLVEALADAPRALMIVNSRRHALALFRAAEAAGLEGVVHLTTRLYAAHRQRVLAAVHARLEAEVPCRLIATSLVEAGVDLDFPRVWRASAGLDQIMQASGRCNREGRRPLEESIVTVFGAPDYPPPSEIAGLIADRTRLTASIETWFRPEVMTEYFKEVYWRVGAKGLDRKGILPMFRQNGREFNFHYRAAAAAFRMIESGMLPVIVAREDEARKVVDDLANPYVSSGALARRLQRYIVQVPPKAHELLRQSGNLVFHAQDLRGEQFPVLGNNGLYHEDTGLLWEDPAYMDVEDTMI
jgi:CRISPR-associated endonuclease/helicase Cas3